MNNNLYKWHDEQMVQHEMREVDRAVEQARLLKEAGLSGGNWLARAVRGLFNLLRRQDKGVQDQRSIEQRA
jgi:hypothetical protein